MLHADDIANNSRGDKGLSIAILYYVSRGYNISIPFNDSQDYDLVIDGPEGLQKVQIKTTIHKNASKGYYVAALQPCGSKKKVSENSYNTLFVFTGNRQVYIIPKKDIGHLGEKLVLSKKYEKYRKEYIL